MTTTDARNSADARNRPEGSRRRLRLTVRARFLTAALTLSALGLTVAGVTAYALQRERLDDDIDGALQRNFQEFRALARDGVDPSTGSAFTTVKELLRIALQRAVPAPDEGMLALVDGVVANTAPSTVRLRIEDDPDIVAEAATRAEDTTVTVRSYSTEMRTYRYVAVPVRVTGDTGVGLLVFAYDRGAEHDALAQTFRTYAYVAAGALVGTGVVGWLLAGRLLSPVRLLRRTAQQITDSDLSARIPVVGDDDLSDLTRTVNAMLDRLEAAFASQRRLLDDAGHELRTPLTIIRGHLELADPDDPADVAAARAVALDEVDRMQRLVDDLVTLATADRPDFVQAHPTDVAELTDEIVDKARHLGHHRWVVTGRAEVRAALDAQRITQAMLQLAANATKFAAPGTLVRVASEVEDGHLRFSVRDEGPGVTAEDAERIFDRFARGRAGSGVEGAGLGLPIVAAIAAAHGGRAFLDPEPGSGATFVVEIPIDPAPPEQEDA